MKLAISLLIILVTNVATAQTLDVTGVYHAGLYSPPSPMYLTLDCDSTYHFIIRYDAGSRKSVYPPLSSKRKWRVDKVTNKILLDSPVYKIRNLQVTDTSTLVSKTGRKKITWTKVVSHDSTCHTRTYVQFYDYSNRTVYTLVPGLQILTKEEFKNNLLAERWTYHRLTIEQMKSLGLDSLKNVYVGKDDYKADPTHQVRMQIGLSELKDWPVERHEKSTELGWEINSYNVDGDLTKQETKPPSKN